MKFWYLITLLVILKFCHSKTNENNKDSFRLPTSVIPEHYKLKIQTYLEEKYSTHISFVQIQIRCMEQTNTITLHSRNLRIKKVKLVDKQGGNMTIKKFELEQEYDFLHIYLNDYLWEGNLYRLEIDFTGKITSSMTGYYRSSYKDKSGQKNWIATTQFEPTNARAAFPCFDEPALKARFFIMLLHQQHLKAISNMPVKTSILTSDIKNWKNLENWDKNWKNMDKKWKNWEEDNDKYWKNWEEENEKKWMNWEKDNDKYWKNKEKENDKYWKNWEEENDKYWKNWEEENEKKWKNMEDESDKYWKNWEEENEKKWKDVEKENDKYWKNWDRDFEKKFENWAENPENNWGKKWQDWGMNWGLHWKRNSGKNLENLKNWKENFKNSKDNSKNREDEGTFKDKHNTFEDNRKMVEGRVKNRTAMRNPVNRSMNKMWRCIIFEETFKMSTYLVAYSLNDFGFKSIKKSNRYGNTIINIWAQKRVFSQVKFATNIAPKILSFFEEYFNIAYPLSKVDFLAVPDLYAGVMENWGLITFRESLLLYEPDVSTEYDKHDIVKSVAHGLSHYWFGNLVSIKWWSYLWLKEGFATYLARVAEEHLFPNLKSFAADVLISDMQAVYEVDALESSRPISAHIRDPSRMHEIYDSITKTKGSCVIRMMESIVGKDVLRKGLSKYLDTYKYNSTEPDNLWNALTKIAHEHKSLSAKLSFKRIMDTWTLQAGFPLVTVNRDYSSNTVTVSQKRFLENTRKHDESCYWVPLTYTTKEARNFNSTKLKKWLSCPKKDITFKLDNSDSWILFNIQASGIYRVNYDERNWKMLTKQLATNHGMIGTLNRVLLIDDVMELAMVGYVDFSIAFDLVKYVRNDDQFATWSRALGKLMQISNLLDHTSNYKLIQTFISNLVVPKFKSFGGLNNLEDISKFQLEIIKVACQIGIKICEQETASMFSKWKRSSGSYNIPKEIREIVYCQGVKNGQRADWDYLWEYYKKSNIPTEKELILGALGCTENHKLLHRYLELIIKADSGIRLQDLGKVFTSVVENKAAYIARVFFYEKVKLIYEIESPKGASMGHLLTIVTKSLRTESEFNEYKYFLKENEQYFKMAHFAKTQTLETLVVRKNWYDNIYPKLVHALKEQIANSATVTT